MGKGLLAGVLGVGVIGAILAGWLLIGADGGGEDESIVMGTTDEVGSLDPAGGYNVGSWMIFNNTFQTLMSYQHGATEPGPEAAQECGFEDTESTVYRCKLRSGLKFSNGNSLTSKDVAHSFNRTLRINSPNGPAYLLASIKKIQTPDARTVIFRLKAPDATFPAKIASNAAVIVDHREYPADKLRKDHKIFGSGVYQLDEYEEKKRAVLTSHEAYKGSAEVKNSAMTVEFFTGEPTKLKKALQAGEVDLAYRGLAVNDIRELETATLAGEGDGVKVSNGASAEVMHLIFNMNDPVAGKLSVRRAMAYLVDRNALIRRVYQRTVEPLYSVIPTGITGHTTPYFNDYGDRPDPDKAAAALRADGITKKVKTTLWVTPNRFGPATVPAFKEIARQLNESGLFDADVKSLPVDEYNKGIQEGKFGFFVRGWLADYPDPDIFVAPFFAKENIVNNGYNSGPINNDLLPATNAEADRARTVGPYKKIQSLVARDLPVLPLWQGRQYTVARENIFGSEWSVDTSTVPRFWEFSRQDG
ncbi:ABC transporter substrate-binding protein [Streptomyces sp. A7024]|uniref:ABC transporter substrate-binding protein n=1 Tax=Streptomyces coryli TaxID=1128680 RepID=A0A6G4U245_9ACTN|nr:ABC transporter substrate-binding protein [Streptomyces coryli]NGN66072.1 ABC transporter substrate-binding protein [Streptomyces coryli]